MKIITLSCLLLSILHSILFWGNQPGVSVVLFTIAALLVIFTILEESDKIVNTRAFLLSIPIILLSSTYFLFNNYFFNICNFFIIFILIAIMIVWATSNTQITFIKLLSKSFLLFFAPVDYFKNAKRFLFKSFHFKSKNKNAKSNIKISKQILKACFICLPLVLLVLFLLMNADDLFANIFLQLFSTVFSNFNIFSILEFLCRIFIIIVIAIYFIAFFLNIFSKYSNFNTDYFKGDGNFKISIQAVTINTLLTLLNIIYLIFSYTQFAQIFAQINTSTSDYAQLARVGFFELMAVSIINFIVILVSKNNHSEQSEFSKKYTKFMSIFIAVFTVIILFSSVFRMRLYEQLYGYTFLRLMVYFVQITELVLIIPTFAYIINKKINLAKCFIVICSVSYVFVNFINIDKTIAKCNIERYLTFKSEQTNSETQEDSNSRYLSFNDIDGLDLMYLESLSTDAAPELAKLLTAPNASQAVKNQVREYLLSLINSLKNEERNIFEFNLSKETVENLKIKEVF